MKLITQIYLFLMYLINYTTLFMILVLVFLISALVFLLSFLSYYQAANDEKNSTYECGFAPFGDARNRFEVRFYLVSILFIVFDLEIAFLLPCVLSLQKFTLFGFCVLGVFLLLIALGFAYE